MSSGFLVSGVDLDSILAPLEAFTPRAAVGILVGGVDIAQRYRASIGGDQISYNTNYLSNGTDLRYLFASISATFALTLVASPTIGGGVEGQGNYIPGTAVPISATPSDPFVFSNWSVSPGYTGGGSFNADNPSTTITMNQAYTVTANFVM